MDIQKKPTLAEKQEFWTEQLPNFESSYWLPSHFEFVVFDIDHGNYEVKDDLAERYLEDAYEIYHRVNTGWAMWKKAINFSQKQARAVSDQDQQVWATSNLTWKDVAFKALSCKVLKSTENWVHVKNVACVGSTTANLICKKLGVNPDGNKFELIEAQDSAND